MELLNVVAKYRCTRPKNEIRFVCKLYFACYSQSDKCWCEDVTNISFRTLSEALACASDPAPFLLGCKKKFLSDEWRYVDYVIYRKSIDVL